MNFYDNESGEVGRSVSLVIQKVSSYRDSNTMRFTFLGSERSDEAAVGNLFCSWDFRRVDPKDGVCTFWHASADSLGYSAEIIG